MVDLFGEIAVSLREIQLWLYKVPRLPHYATRRPSYTRQWNVVDKIRAAKRRGDLEQILGDESCEFCGQGLYAEIVAVSVGVPALELSLLRRRIAVLELLITPGAASSPPRRAQARARSL